MRSPIYFHFIVYACLILLLWVVCLFLLPAGAEGGEELFSARAIRLRF